MWGFKLLLFLYLEVPENQQGNNIISVTDKVKKKIHQFERVSCSDDVVLERTVISDLRNS